MMMILDEKEMRQMQGAAYDRGFAAGKAYCIRQGWSKKDREFMEKERERENE